MTSGAAPWIRLAGLAALGVASSLSLYLLAQREPGYDFTTYLQAAARLVRGENIYLFTRDALSVGILREFLYPPPVAALFVPLLALPLSVAVMTWFVLMFAVAVVVGALLVVPVPSEWRPWAGAAYVLFFPLIWEVSLGNLTLLTLLFCLIGWRVGRRPWLAGASFAGALSLKLLPVTLLPFLVLAGRARVAALTLAVGLAVVVVTVPFMAEAWREYLALVVGLSVGTPLSGPNIVPTFFAGTASRFLLPMVAIGVAALAGIAARRRRVDADYAFALALAAAPLLSSSVRYPYLLLALPLLLAPGTGTAMPRPLVFGLVAARVLVWLGMQAQAWPEPGRSFTLPLYALLGLILVGLIPLLPIGLPTPRRGEALALAR